jgi:hypothetical protein
LIDFLDNVLCDYKYHLSKIEFSFDFKKLATADSMEFMAFNRMTLYIKRRGKPLNLNYDETQYMNNVRKHRSVGVKGYLKNDSFYRFEITLKTPFLNEQSVRHVKDIYSLTPSIVTERVAYRVIDFDAWRKGFHRFPEHNNRYNEQDVEKEIKRIAREICFGDAVKYARKFVKRKKEFLRIHPFELIFKVATQDSFIKHQHPECIHVVDPCPVDPDVDEMTPFTQGTHQVDKKKDGLAGYRDSFDDFASVDGIAAERITVPGMMDNLGIYLMEVDSVRRFAVTVSWHLELVQYRFWKTDYG